MTERVATIRIRRTGGFAGLALTADVGDPHEVERIRADIEARSAAVSSDARDTFTYRFESFDASGERVQTVEVPEAALSPATRELLGRLLAPA